MTVTILEFCNIHTVTELKELFYARAKNIAEKYDKRDRETSYVDELNEIIYPE